jgi:hypothetical protein
LSYADINNQASDDEYCPKSDTASSGLLRQLNRIYANSSYCAQHPDDSEKVIRDTTRKTRKQYSAEAKIRIVLDGLRGEGSIAELCIFPASVFTASATLRFMRT